MKTFDDSHRVIGPQFTGQHPFPDEYPGKSGSACILMLLFDLRPYPADLQCLVICSIIWPTDKPSYVPPGDTAQNTVIEEVSLKRGNINDDDVFILDAGLTIYQLNGEKCDKDEKVKAMQFVIKIKEERNGKAKSYVYDGEVPDEVNSGDDVSKDLLDPNDVFLVDVGTHLYVWVGNDASRDEKKNGMSYASNYLNGEDRFHCPITVLLQEQAKDVINGLI
eukprot:sb/3469820/